MPAILMPHGAETGEDIFFRPYMKRNAAARSADPVIKCTMVVNMSGP
jgi:hypothetical protein